jgi:Ca2+-binding RTX toxin-like protein
MRRRCAVGCAAAVATVLGLALPGPASAATLTREFGSALIYIAADSEANSLDVRLDGSSIVFRDTGAVITTDVTTQDCTHPDQNTVVCPPVGPPGFEAFRSVRAELRDRDDSGTLDLPLMASLLGGDGSDVLTVSTGTPAAVPVEARGEAGNDTLAVGTGQVLLYGGPGDDGLTAGAQGGSLLHGDAGSDRLVGGPGFDPLAGDDGADVIVAGDGDDQIQGDYFFLAGPGDYGPDNVDAGPGNDTVDAAGGNDVVTGGPGNDRLVGGLGDDRMAGAEGDDMLDGGSGSDTLGGDAGNDTIGGADGADRATGGAGGDLIFGGIDNDRLTGGGPGATGTDRGDRVDGEDGSDVVAGGPGQDALFGGAGDDKLVMGRGGDGVDAGADDDDIEAIDRAAGRIGCGAGEDAVAPDARDRTHIDCETIERPVTCLARWRARCTVIATISTTARRATIVGRGSIRLRPGRTRTLRVPLSSRARTIVRRAKRIDVRLATEYRTRKQRRRNALTTFSLHAKLPAPAPQ